MPLQQRAMQEFIARENLSRWTAQLADSRDERQRETLRQLLVLERRHLRDLTGESA